MSFSIIALHSGVTRISLEGDLDVSTIEGLRPELQGVARRCPAQVEMELCRLRSIHPQGMRVLLSFLESVGRVGCRIKINGLREQPLDTFKAILVSAILNAPAPPN